MALDFTKVHKNQKNGEDLRKNEVFLNSESRWQILENSKDFKYKYSFFVGLMSGEGIGMGPG